VLQFVLDQASIEEDCDDAAGAENNQVPDFVLGRARRKARAAGRRRSTTSTRLPPAACRSPPRSPHGPVGCCWDGIIANPFQTHPSYKATRSCRCRSSGAVCAARCPRGDPERDADLDRRSVFFRPNYDKMYLSAIPRLRTPLENALATGRRQGRQPEELAYDAMLSDGRGMLMCRFLNYADATRCRARDAARSAFVPGLSDGGAHCGIIRRQLSRPIC